MIDKVNLHVYQSTYHCERRIQRAVNALSKRGIFQSFILVGIRGENKNDEAELRALYPAEVTFLLFRLFTRRSSFVYKIINKLIFNFKILYFVLSKRIDTVTCHSLPELPLCTIIAKIKSCRLVYDAHELETETYCSRGVRKRTLKIVETVLIRFVDSLITVNQSIASWYKDHYTIENIYIVRNIPDKRPNIDKNSVNLKRDLGVGSDEVLFIYQGILAKERGIYESIDIFKEYENKHILFLGYGDEENNIKLISQECGNIHYHSAVPSDELLCYTACADIGIFLLENSCLSYYYCLPNKVYEYLLAGIPILVPNFPELASLVKQYECGWLLPDRREEYFSFIDSLSRVEIERKKMNVRKMLSSISWEAEVDSLMGAYS